VSFHPWSRTRFNMKASILYIEENKFDRAAFQRFITSYPNINYDIASSLKEAREKLKNADFDLIVTDNNLQDGDAFDVLRLKDSMPVVVTAGTGNEEIAVKLMKAGARDYLLKDVESNYLKILPVVIENTLKNIKAEKALLESQLALEHSRELQEKKDEFISLASHELKTPLTSVKASIQIMGKFLKEDGQVNRPLLVDIVDRTERYVARLEYLISSLLDVSTIQAGQLLFNFDYFDFNVMVTECLEGIKHSAPGKEFIVEGAVKRNVYGDRLRLEQVLINYLSNAVKYAPDAKKVVVHLGIKDNEVVAGVQDFGIGIEPEDCEKIFGRFFRAEDSDNKFSGLGIGLYICKEIIQRHHGQAWVESEKGKGSTFYFSLPVDNGGVQPS
jgi:two-component system, sensor histidine kinase and response regulator